MRLFIALIPNEETVDAVCGIQNELKALGVRGNYPPRANIHLTLAFIGEYGDPQKALSVIKAAGEPSFAIETGDAGKFNGVWWVGVRAGRGIYEYAAKIRDGLRQAGIPFDKKPFSPHLTILRRPDREDIPPLTVPKAVTPAPRVALMRSDRGERGMIYTEIK